MRSMSVTRILSRLEQGDPSAADQLLPLIYRELRRLAAEKMANEIRLVKPTHYSCFFDFGPMDPTRARRSMERFGAEVLPLLRKELGDDFGDSLLNSATPPAETSSTL